MLDNILSVVGLFVPVPLRSHIEIVEGKSEKEVRDWVFTMQIGKVPLGWIMLFIAWIL